jgi:hypothetical protein
MSYTKAQLNVYELEMQRREAAKAPEPMRCEMCGDSGKIPILDPATQKVTGEPDGSAAHPYIATAAPAQEALCGVVWEKMAELGHYVCAEPKGHKGHHDDHKGSRWYTDHLPAAQPVSAPSPVIPEDHIEHVKAFLNEMYATMIDPCAEGVMKVGEMCAALIEAARQQRQQIYDHADALRVAREERDIWKRGCESERELHETWRDRFLTCFKELKSEREARKQEADAQFNAGIEAAAKVACGFCGESYSNVENKPRVPVDDPRLFHHLKSNGEAYALCYAGAIHCLSKSVSGSPERLEEPKP